MPYVRLYLKAICMSFDRRLPFYSSQFEMTKGGGDEYNSIGVRIILPLAPDFFVGYEINKNMTSCYPGKALSSVRARGKSSC